MRIILQYIETSFAACHTVEDGPGSSVGIATGYGLDGPGIESWWGGLGPTQPPVQWVPGPSQG